MDPEAAKKSKISENTNDWMQGYGYQMWRCHHNAYRADGADGQYILIIPEKDAVIAVTAHIGDAGGTGFNLEIPAPSTVNRCFVYLIFCKCPQEKGNKRNLFILIL